MESEPAYYNHQPEYSPHMEPDSPPAEYYQNMSADQPRHMTHWTQQQSPSPGARFPMMAQQQQEFPGMHGSPGPGDPRLGFTPEPAGKGRGKAKQDRAKYSRTHLEILNYVFARQRYPTIGQQNVLAQRLGIKPQQMKFWFQNRRRKESSNKQVPMPTGCVEESVLANIYREMVREGAGAGGKDSKRNTPEPPSTASEDSMEQQAARQVQMSSQYQPQAMQMAFNPNQFPNQFGHPFMNGHPGNPRPDEQNGHPGGLTPMDQTDKFTPNGNPFDAFHQEQPGFNPHIQDLSNHSSVNEQSQNEEKDNGDGPVYHTLESRPKSQNGSPMEGRFPAPNMNPFQGHPHFRFPPNAHFHEPGMMRLPHQPHTMHYGAPRMMEAGILPHVPCMPGQDGPGLEQQFDSPDSENFNGQLSNEQHGMTDQAQVKTENTDETDEQRSEIQPYSDSNAPSPATQVDSTSNHEHSELPVKVEENNDERISCSDDPRKEGEPSESKDGYSSLSSDNSGDESSKPNSTFREPLDIPPSMEGGHVDVSPQEYRPRPPHTLGTPHPDVGLLEGGYPIRMPRPPMQGLLRMASQNAALSSLPPHLRPRGFERMGAIPEGEDGKDKEKEGGETGIPDIRMGPLHPRFHPRSPLDPRFPHLAGQLDPRQYDPRMGHPMHRAPMGGPPPLTSIQPKVEEKSPRRSDDEDDSDEEEKSPEKEEERNPAMGAFDPRMAGVRMPGMPDPRTGRMDPRMPGLHDPRMAGIDPRMLDPRMAGLQDLHRMAGMDPSKMQEEARMPHHQHRMPGLQEPRMPVGMDPRMPGLDQRMAAEMDQRMAGMPDPRGPHDSRMHGLGPRMPGLQEPRMPGLDARFHSALDPRSPHFDPRLAAMHGLDPRLRMPEPRMTAPGMDPRGMDHRPAVSSPTAQHSGSPLHRMPSPTMNSPYKHGQPIHHSDANEESKTNPHVDMLREMAERSGITPNENQSNDEDSEDATSDHEDEKDPPSRRQSALVPPFYHSLQGQSGEQNERKEEPSESPPKKPEQEAQRPDQMSLPPHLMMRPDMLRFSHPAMMFNPMFQMAMSAQMSGARPPMEGLRMPEGYPNPYMMHPFMMPGLMGASMLQGAREQYPGGQLGLHGQHGRPSHPDIQATLAGMQRSESGGLNSAPGSERPGMHPSIPGMAIPGMHSAIPGMPSPDLQHAMQAQLQSMHGGLGGAFRGAHPMMMSHLSAESMKREVSN